MIIYEDKDLIAVEKSAGITVYSENSENSLIETLIKEFPYLKEVGEPPRYGVVHRLDKETSGVLLIAKNNESLKFLQKRFKDRKVIKEYVALVAGNLPANEGVVKTLLGRSRKNGKKQKAYSPYEPGAEGKREAVTEYRVLKRFKGCTLLKVYPKTGRKHQIRCHFAHISHPIIGDKIYGFKSQLAFKDLKRQFLHASCLKIALPNGEEKEFRSELPNDLKKTLENLN